jgi:hypothetical protein
LASNEKLAEAAGVEIKGFLPKPYTTKELLDSIGKLI